MLSHSRRTMTAIHRCINLDWLEVTALEPLSEPHDAEYFRLRGLNVVEREYGTKVWGQMFTIDGDDHLPFMEVRRAPKSEIIAPNIVHLRFTNRACYFDHAATIMANFLDEFGYEFHHIARVDICSDFEHFDYGDKPADFMRRFMEGRYSKINQANIHAHGSDEWAGRVWNSLSWGSPTSDIGTKFYNKTLELYDPVTKRYGKPYIRQAWYVAGLIDDAANMLKHRPDGTSYTPEIWRVEFSIRSSVRRWFTIRLNGRERDVQSVRNTLDMYDSSEKLLIMFASLSQHYFHFKHLVKRYDFYREGHSSGHPLRKDRCPDKLLFNWKAITTNFKVEKSQVATSQRPDRSLVLLLAKLREYRECTLDQHIRATCTILIDHLAARIERADQTNPITRAEVNAMREVLGMRTRGCTIDPALLLRLAREELHLRSEIIDIF